jgi:uncharacterized protein YcbX
MTPIEVGKVRAIFRYPVKSMASESMDSIEVGWHGLAGDRRWAFVRDGLERSGFPWLTIRERPEMWRYQPYFADPDQPDTSLTMVRTPDGDELDVVDPALANELGSGARVIKQGRGVFDTFPLSLITTQTISELSAMVDSTLDPKRFRPNLLVEATSHLAFAEDEWVGSVLSVGTLKMRVDKRDKRCVMINVDPETTERDPEILRAVARERQACLGVYGSTVEPGIVSVGDSVILHTEIS